MSRKQNKKQPPPRPPPPNFSKYKSRSSYNLAHRTSPPDLMEWSPPNSPRTTGKPHQFGGSVSSSYSSSSSSLASSKKSLENDMPFSFSLTLNLARQPAAAVHRPAPPPPDQDHIQSQPVLEQETTLFSTYTLDINRRELPALPGQKLTIIRAPTNRKNQPPWGDGSPPMPNVPPPSPPEKEAAVITPYGIALFNFPESQPGDLPLQVDDVVFILRRVNDDWLYGRIDDREGIFPENFIRIEVPLPGEDQILTALYEFTPTMSGDLKLLPGYKVRVLKRINKDWLYGESNGQVGQFPNNYVC